MVRFLVTVKNKDHEVIVELALNQVEKDEATDPTTSAPGDLGPPLPKGFEFARQPCKEVSVVPWPLKKPTDDTSLSLNTLKCTIGFLMGSIAEQLPSYGESDFAVFIRDAQTEVWTLKNFAPGTLLLAPMCTEFKD
eukprot:16289817-Heterocapsa_arctica.AAC.1